MYICICMYIIIVVYYKNKNPRIWAWEVNIPMVGFYLEVELTRYVAIGVLYLFIGSQSEITDYWFVTIGISKFQGCSISLLNLITLHTKLSKSL